MLGKFFTKPLRVVKLVRVPMHVYGADAARCGGKDCPACRLGITSTAFRYALYHNELLELHHWSAVAKNVNLEEGRHYHLRVTCGLIVGATPVTHDGPANFKDEETIVAFLDWCDRQAVTPLGHLLAAYRRDNPIRRRPLGTDWQA